MKYIYSDDKAKDAHWDFCEKKSCSIYTIK